MAKKQSSGKACKCKIEFNHLNSMQLMVMEAMADKRWDSAKWYVEGPVKDTIKNIGKCTGADMTSALSCLKDTTKYIDQKEEGIRVTLRTLEDAYWMAIAKSCTE